MSFISSLFSGGASQLVDSVGNVLDKVVTTKEEKMQLENELKKADFEFQIEMQKLGVEEKKLAYGDIDSARKREADVQTSSNATKLSKNVSPILALGTVLLTFTLFYILIFRPDMCSNGQTKDVLIYILGVLSAILTQVYSFYFGSSQGSQAKNALIEKMQGEKQQGA
jgi:hypothetical protein